MNKQHRTLNTTTANITLPTESPMDGDVPSAVPPITPARAVSC